jgi:glycosyltransferase involved in cell wall biosynthesis
MLFSVIIPTHNRAALVAGALESVRAQRFTDFEVIVVDNGSTDGTAEFIARLGTLVHVISQTNLGPGGGRNAGALQARGDYIAFLDDDDQWFPWTLACFAELIGRHSRPAMLGAKLKEFSVEAQLKTVTETALRADVFADYFASSRAGCFVGAGMLVVRRDEFIKTGGFTQKWINAEDHDLVLRMGIAQGFVKIIEPTTLGWRKHGCGATDNLAASCAGSCHLIEQERRRAYPGGEGRARERRTIVTRHVRPVSLECLRQGKEREAWKLYRETFAWHLRLGKWKYLGGFPLKFLLTRA